MEKRSMQALVDRVKTLKLETYEYGDSPEESLDRLLYDFDDYLWALDCDYGAGVYDQPLDGKLRNEYLYNHAHYSYKIDGISSDELYQAMRERFGDKKFA